MFRRSKLLVEDGIVVGNTLDKGQVANPLAKKMVANFDKTLTDLITTLDVASVLEVGCGEGRVTKIILENTDASVHGVDISDTVVEKARANVTSVRASFDKRSIYELEQAAHRSELVVCCEVMEHLYDPDRGLHRLAEVAAPYCLLSVPWEPLWRCLNMARGAYLTALGNTPGHVQHWSKRSFLKFVSQQFEILEVRSPFPWTMILCRCKQ